jgi:hypothetical protein
VSADGFKEQREEKEQNDIKRGQGKLSRGKVEWARPRESRRDSDRDRECEGWCDLSSAADGNSQQVSHWDLESLRENKATVSCIDGTPVRKGRKLNELFRRRKG